MDDEGYKTLIKAIDRITISRVAHYEEDYLLLLRKVVARGEERMDRTKVGTLALFGQTMKFSLTHCFPLLTTKRMWFNGIVKELLWMISGSTDSKKLAEAGCSIWDANGTREFLDSQGHQEREVGDLGPVYGFQMRHFGAVYVDCNTDYTGQGIDQLEEVIRLIKTDPHNRRIVMNFWNASQLKEMALPPCHMFCQFFVSTKFNTLSCQMYQRSCDMALGVPFNIASYALLTMMIAHVCDLIPGTLTIVMGDTHVYKTHLIGVHHQLGRKPCCVPRLEIKRRVEHIDDFKFEDFELLDYNPHGKIEFSMAV